MKKSAPFFTDASERASVARYAPTGSVADRGRPRRWRRCCRAGSSHATQVMREGQFLHPPEARLPFRLHGLACRVQLQTITAGAFRTPRTPAAPLPAGGPATRSPAPGGLVPLHRDFDGLSEPTSAQMQGARARDWPRQFKRAQHRSWALVGSPAGSPPARPRRCWRRST